MLIEELKKREDGDSMSHQAAKSLNHFAELITSNAKDHAKRILSQLPEFDLHDDVHQSAVLTNIEQIVGQLTLSKLSSYELFFLYAASYLHDVGMALPDWELNVIEAVETENNKDDVSWKIEFRTNGQGAFAISTARQLIKKHSSEIYRNFESVSKWFFAPDSEDRLIEHLANTVVQYQDFRSGFSSKLKSLVGSELSNEVKALRIDFIRHSHHSRSYSYVKGLGRHIPEEIMQPWGTAIAHDLAFICQAHGEPIAFVEKMKTDAKYVGAETANLQFVALLLRIADILHFSFDRAPSVLASEIQFRSEDSFIHWAIKQQGVNYDISESGEVGKKTVRFRAYCLKPRYYYALHKYLDWVDQELVNYARVSRRWELSFGKPQSERWSIPLADEVDRSGVGFDKDKFIPVRGLSFTLEQKRILELLMGVRLYKDKYACLRELYQNSLDACKCMIALSDGKEKGRVEFWIERKDSGKVVYLCCMDNGVGMTKDIIVNHLLRIGNSYYSSSSFERLRNSHQHSFTPTSQFGIGILSCFMLGDSLDIVTKPMQEFADDTSAIRCVVDGVHENFYYAQPDDVDMELIGKHGTIVRVRLTEPESITDYNDGKIWFRYFADRTAQMFKNIEKPLFEGWDRHIHHVVTRFVSLPLLDVNVCVRLIDATRVPIIRWDCPFKWKEHGIDESDIIRLDEFCKVHGWSHGIGEFDKGDITESHNEIYFCKTDYEGVEFSWLLELPSRNEGASSISRYGTIPSFGVFGLSVDGVHIEHNSLVQNDLLHWLCYSGHLNFTGEIRPVLTVDRMSITSLPETIDIIISQLIRNVAVKTIQTTNEHIEKKGMSSDDPIVLAIWDHLLNGFSPCKVDFLTTFASDERFTNVLLSDLATLVQNKKLTIREFIDAEKLTFQQIAYPDLSAIAKLLFYGKCGNATRLTLLDDGVYVEGTGLSPIVTKRVERHEHHFTDILLKCDDWSGRFSEYDLVTDFWPVIPERLFDCLSSKKNGDHAEKLGESERAIEIHRMGNGITSLGEQDPCMVHPDFGLYTEEKNYFNQKSSEVCKVGNFAKASNHHWLFELNQVGKMNEKMTRNILFMFVSPRLLNTEEDARLKEFESSAPDYVKGVRQGWSLLFLGQKHHQPIIHPGMVKRSVMARLIPEAIWNKLEGEEYHFLDGTPLVEFRDKAELKV
ncbi:hypothetical protein G9409_05830 [Chlorobium sp. BLA1]|uniref:HD domain-containing protein n=1 Tax=Candidatus Chlorobium masyuteum TaxID=2716876 RepID=UPI0014213DC6|nr:ATP-binding protein [Candidatus Chlorobium masyuteum]NHQ60112.1 hypothetical protein [Candidatus Chlorobium masyuteum]